VPIEGAAADVGGLRLVAESTGGRRNRIDTLLVCRVPEPTPDGRAPDDRAAEEHPPTGATRADQPAGVEG
jgi:hypothetical protein